MNPDRVVLVLPPEPAWLPLLEEVARRFADQMRFSPPLREGLASATLEACENLVLLARERGDEEAYQVAFAADRDAATVSIAYSARLPLNPHLAEDYEVPHQPSDLAEVKADALWLHLIKRRMDKVFFRVEGARHVLSLVKYRRLEGREGELWVMRLVPRLSPEVKLDGAPSGGGQAAACLLYHPGNKVVLRLGPGERFLVERMDGRKSMYDLYMEHTLERGLISPDTLASLYESLEKHGMLEAGGPKGGGRRLFWRHLLNPSFSIPRADRAVEAVHRRLAWLLNPWGAALLLAIGLSGFYPWLAGGLPGRRALAGLEAFYGAHPQALVALYLLMLAGAAVHEFAHGVVCKHFGGRVHRLGVMFYLAMFIFYCDTTSAYAFPKTCQKVLVSLAGPLASFALLGMGLWAAAATVGSGSPWEFIWISYCLLLLFSLIMNFNPFIKMDAYFMVMDLLGIPNLRERSFAFLRGRLRGLLGLGAGRDSRGGGPAAGPRERRVFWWYGLLGALFTAGVVIYPLVYFGWLLAEHSANRGRLVMGGLVVFLVFLRLADQAFRQAHAWRHREYRLL